MLISKLFSKYFNSSEPLERVINLPIEVWFHIWSFLDFNTRQKKCTRVSKEWLHQIRNSTRLSGEMILRLENRNVEDINDALFRWPRLKVLYLSDGCRNCKCKYGQLSKIVSDWKKMKEFALNIKLTEHALLRKIVVAKTIPFVELGDWGKATKFWFDPKNWPRPATLRNVLNLKIYVNIDPKCFEVMRIRKRLRNMEKLYITGKRGMFDAKFDSEFISSLPTFILGFRKLTQVWISVNVDVTDFIDLLYAIANIKDVKCWLNVCIVHNYFGERYVKGFFEEGFKIVEKTFPTESTNVHIFDCRYYFRIDKNYNREPLLMVCETSDDEEFTESDPKSIAEQFEGFEDDEDSDVEDYRENSSFVTKCYQFMDFLQRVSCNGFLFARTTIRTFQILVACILHVVVSFVAHILHVGVSFVAHILYVVVSFVAHKLSFFHNLSLPTRVGLTIFLFFADILLLYLTMYIVKTYSKQN